MTELKYSIISGSPKDKKEINLYNKAYELWKSQWRPLLKEKFTADDFFRQDYISVYTHHLNIVAIHLYTIFDQSLECIQDHSYFTDYPENFLSLMKEQDISRMATCESLTIHPDYRKSELSVHLAAVIFQMTGKISDNLGVDALIGPCMKVNGVNTMATSAGGITLAKDIMYKGLDCDLVYFKPGSKKIPSTNVQIDTLYKELWLNRSDYTGLTVEDSKKIAL